MSNGNANQENRCRQALRDIIDGATDFAGMPAGSNYQELLIILNHILATARAALNEEAENDR